MRKLSINTFVSLDGVIQAPGGPEEDPSGNFKFGGWSFHYWDDMMGKIMEESMDKPFELLLGRKTYEIFASHWPYMKDDPVAEKFNSISKYVVSKSLDKVDWEHSVLIKQNVVEEIRKLRSQEGPELQVHGSGNLIQTLVKHKLIDLFRIWIFPVVLGNGKRLFEADINTSLNLLDSKTSTTGVIIGTYEPGEELKTGSFALPDPTDKELIRRKKLASES